MTNYKFDLSKINTSGLDTSNVVIDDTVKMSDEAISRTKIPIPNRPIVDFKKALDNQLTKVLRERVQQLSNEPS